MVITIRNTSLGPCTTGIPACVPQGLGDGDFHSDNPYSRGVSNCSLLAAWPHRYGSLRWLSDSVFSRRIAHKTLPPMIMVYASGSSQTNYCDSYDGKYMVETTIIKELIPYIDKNYRTNPSREGRAIQGMSMGGFGAMRLALKYPDLFSSVVAFAGGNRWPEEMSVNPHPSFAEMFNSDPEIFRANHPETWARRNADKIRGKLAIRIYVGTEDPGLKGNRRMHALLEELKIPHGYQEFEGIAHNLKLLAEHVNEQNFAFAARQWNTALDPGPPIS
jgi:S-formylglutathione hydrolase FrmB